MRRDNHTCRYCGAQAPDVKLTIDHVTPVTLGGQDVPENLVTACADCNAGKSSSPPDAALVADVDQRAVEWGQAMEVAVERRAAELAAERATTDPFDAAWSRWTVGGQPVPRDANWRNSVLRFLAVGLTDQFFTDAIETSMGQDRIPAVDKWKYFCGVCWREVDNLQAVAKVVLAEGQDGSWEASAKMVVDPIEFIANRGDVMPKHQVTLGLHPEFPSIALAEQFVTDLIEALGASPAVIPLAVDALWHGMSDAYDEFTGWSLDPNDGTDAVVRATFNNSTVWMLHRIKDTNSSVHL